MFRITPLCSNSVTNRMPRATSPRTGHLNSGGQSNTTGAANTGPLLTAGASAATIGKFNRANQSVRRGSAAYGTAPFKSAHSSAVIWCTVIQRFRWITYSVAVRYVG